MHRLTTKRTTIFEWHSLCRLPQQRFASHKSQGRATKAKQGDGRRLGAKKTGGQYVVTGNILFRQRGMDWWPGENCFMGRDHTIHAGQPGYVRYYRDPNLHSKRKYIGIALNKDQALPYSPFAPKRRRLGLLAFPISEKPQQEPVAIPKHAQRVTNWSIGQKMDQRPVVPYKAGDRRAAWANRRLRQERVIEKRAIGKGAKKKPVKAAR